MDSNPDLSQAQQASPSVPLLSTQGTVSATSNIFNQKVFIVFAVILVVGVMAIFAVYKYVKMNGGNHTSSALNTNFNKQLPVPTDPKDVTSKDCGTINSEHVFEWGVTGDAKSLTAQDHASALCMTEALLQCKPAHQIGIFETEKGKFSLKDEIFGVEESTCRVRSEQANNTGVFLCKIPLSLLVTWKKGLASSDYAKTEPKGSADYFYNTNFFPKTDEASLCANIGPTPY